MLSWYGLAEPDIVEAFEAEHNVKFKPKYYAGGDNMLAALASRSRHLRHHPTPMRSTPASSSSAAIWSTR